MAKQFGLICVLLAGTLALTSGAASSRAACTTLVVAKGHYATIQAAVNRAKPCDWVLVAPGVYHESVVIKTPNLHLRGLDRNRVIVDGRHRRGVNGIEVAKADNVWIENLTVRNFDLNPETHEDGNEIWWNGGDGSGHIGLSGFWGNYLTATSSYSSTVPGAFGPCCGVHYPAGDYGIFSSNSTNGFFKHSYASNMADSAYYIGACQQVCNQVMENDQGENSALCLSSTNAGGYLLVKNNECDNNKSGLVSNSQNNDDWPSPQIGLCPPGQTGPLGTRSCTVWTGNYIHDNNNPNVPGNGSGLAGGSPVGTGMVLAGSTYTTLSGNTVTHNGSWGELIADLPDQETPPPDVTTPCQGGIYLPAPEAETCYFPAYGNVSENNTFSGNGFFGNPSNGDIGLATAPHDPGNCFARDSVPDGTDPPGIETNPIYQPSGGMCETPNSGDQTVLAAEVLCASQLIASCPSLPGANYPRPAAQFSLPPVPSGLPSMPEPCAEVPKNPWCP